MGHLSTTECTYPPTYLAIKHSNLSLTSLMLNTSMRMARTAPHSRH